MAIWVSPLSKVAAIFAKSQPARVISLLDPEWTFPEFGQEYSGRHLRLSFHDAHIPATGQLIPSTKHIRTLLAFLATWKRSDALLIHCRAGIGRSTAAAFIAACLAFPEIEEAAIAVALRRASPCARPNEVLVSLADCEMGREGRMLQAITSTGVGLPAVQANENEPFELMLP
jgi:predicted protein tyrosine phosphatase